MIKDICQADEALKQCWNWLEGKNISGR
ncbi:Imm6 family immunity protein [Acetivibrio clariflavus]|nr:Imm6 family immunity protein [Acetivibrio clariflavus]